MKHPRQITSVIIAAAVGLAGPALFAQAQSQAETAPPTEVSRAEDTTPVSSTATGKTSGTGTIKEINAQQFEIIDRDNDDHINLAEFTSSTILAGVDGVAPGQTATVAAPRTDGSVLVKPANGRNTPELFSRLDKDRDGFLDSVEIAAFYLHELED